MLLQPYRKSTSAFTSPPEIQKKRCITENCKTYATRFYPNNISMQKKKRKKKDKMSKNASELKYLQ